MEYLTAADYLLIAERVTDIPAGQLARLARTLPAAESALSAPAAGFGDYEAYEGIAEKAAVLCSRLVRNHPLPDGNKRAALLAMLEFIERNGATWTGGAGDPVAEVIERLASGETSEAEFAEWVAARVAR